MRRMYSEKQVKELSKEQLKSTPSGEISSVLGLNSSGEPVKGSISGGTQLYKHVITGEIAGDDIEIQLASNDNTKITTLSALSSFLNRTSTTKRVVIFISGYNGASGNVYSGYVYNMQQGKPALVLGYDDNGSIELEALSSSLTNIDDVVSSL